MKTWTTLFAVVAIVLACLWAWSRGEHVPDPSQNPTEQTSRSTDVVIASESDEQQVPPRTAVTTEDSNAAKNARVYGRVVRETGTPLADCTVELNGALGHHDRLQEYMRDENRVPWTPLPAETTDFDGRFAFEFVPPPPLQFSLSIRHEDHVTLRRRLTQVQFGQDVDIGDVVLPHGAHVHGRVIDRNGAAHAGVQIGLSRPPTRTGKFEMDAIYFAESRDDGSFAFDKIIPMGTWKAETAGKQLESPASLVVEPSHRNIDLEIFVIPKGEVATIDGVVVDRSGRPIDKVRVSFTPRAHGSHRRVRTAADGSFRLEKAIDDPPGPITIRLAHAQLEQTPTEEKLDWGARDVRLVMRRGSIFSIRVVDDATESPIENFGWNIQSHPDERSGGNRMESPRPRPNGVAELQGLPRHRRHLLAIHPPRDADWAQPSPLELELSNGDNPQVELRVARLMSRVLRVIDAAGKAVPDTRVQLLEPLSETPITLSTSAIAHGRSFRSMKQARALVDATTGSSGQVTLRAAGEAVCALRILGPGHEPLVKTDIQLSQIDEPWTVRVAAGSVVTGRVRPVEVLAQLWQYADADETILERERIQRAPGLALQQGSVILPTSELGKVLLERDGTFRFEGVPKGDWQLKLVARHGRGMRVRQSVATIQALRAGETREVEVSLHEMLRATLRGRARIDGAPFVGKLRLMATGDTKGIRVESDHEGRFEVLVPPGVYRAWVVSGRPALESESEVPVVLGATNDATFDFHAR